MSTISCAEKVYHASPVYLAHLLNLIIKLVGSQVRRVLLAALLSFSLVETSALEYSPIVVVRLDRAGHSGDVEAQVEDGSGEQGAHREVIPRVAVGSDQAEGCCGEPSAPEDLLVVDSDAQGSHRISGVVVPELGASDKALGEPGTADHCTSQPHNQHGDGGGEIGGGDLL
mgnify:CR=1 FL=1